MYRLRQVSSPPGAPPAVATLLSAHGIPERGVGGEYVALDSPSFLEASPGLLALGRAGLTGRICLDVESLEVVHVPSPAVERVNPVNSTLLAFSACISAAIAAFPYYTYETAEDLGEEVATILRQRLLGIDPMVAAHNGLWETFLDDVAMGNYAEEEYEPPDDRVAERRF